MNTIQGFSCGILGSMSISNDWINRVMREREWYAVKFHREELLGSTLLSILSVCNRLHPYRVSSGGSAQILSLKHTSPLFWLSSWSSVIRYTVTFIRYAQRGFPIPSSLRSLVLADSGYPEHPLVLLFPLSWEGLKKIQSIDTWSPRLAPSLKVRLRNWHSQLAFIKCQESVSSCLETLSCTQGQEFLPQPYTMVKIPASL